MTTPVDGAPSGAPVPPSGDGSGQTDATSGTSAAGAPSGTEPTTPPVVTQADYDRIKNQLQAADRNRQAAQDELKKIQDRDLTEADKQKRDLAEAQQKLVEYEEKTKKLQLENAFMTDNTYKWQDPKAALKLSDLSGVEINDKGKVTGLKEALKACAEAYPWMLKVEGDAGTSGGDTGSGSSAASPAAPRVTGVQGGTGQAGNGTNKTEMEKKFPALRGRVT